MGVAVSGRRCRLSAGLRRQVSWCHKGVLRTPSVSRRPASASPSALLAATALSVSTVPAATATTEDAAATGAPAGGRPPGRRAAALARHDALTLREARERLVVRAVGQPNHNRLHAPRELLAGPARLQHKGRDWVVLGVVRVLLLVGSQQLPRLRE